MAPSLREEGRLLAEQAILTPRAHRPHRVLADWAELLAEVREGGIARVRYAGALDDAQVERLRGALSREMLECACSAHGRSSDATSTRPSSDRAARTAGHPDRPARSRARR